MNRDPIFDTVSSYLRLPSGWGFPASPSDLPIESQTAKFLRQALIPASDDEGLAQLVRWHYSVIRSRPAIALGIGQGNAVYDPGLAWKPPVAIGTGEIQITADPASGLMRLGWKPGASDISLSGEIRVDGTDLYLNLGGVNYPLIHTTAYAGGIAIVWPEFLDLQLGFTALPTASFPIVFRPSGFDAPSFVNVITPLITSSMLAFTDVAYEWATGDSYDKLALAWAILQDIRHGS